jgi:hypothetical protein
MASVRVLDVTSFSVTQPLVVQEITMDITKPVDDKPFDGERIGTTVIIPDGHVIEVKGNLKVPPDEGNVWEGRLVNAGGSGYMLSLGEFTQNGTLYAKEQMVKPVYIYGISSHTRAI